MRYAKYGIFWYCRCVRDRGRPRPRSLAGGHWWRVAGSLHKGVAIEGAVLDGLGQVPRLDGVVVG